MLFTSYTGYNRINNRNAGVSVRRETTVGCLDSYVVLSSLLESLVRALFPAWFGARAPKDETR